MPVGAAVGVGVPDGAVVGVGLPVGVPVGVDVPVGVGLVFAGGEAWACAGEAINSIAGLIHLSGNEIAAVTPEIVATTSTFRRSQ